MGTNKLYKTFFAAAILSLTESIGYIYYIFSFRFSQSGISPSLLILLSVGIVVILFIITILIKAKPSNMLSIYQQYYKNFRDYSLFVFVNAAIIAIFLWIKPGNLNDFIADTLSIRLSQYFPLILLFAVLAIQCFVLLIVASYLLKRAIFEAMFEGKNQWMMIEILFFSSLLLYFSTARYLKQLSSPKIAFFPELAEAFLNKHLYLIDPPSTKDLSLFAGKYYVSFPPLAAILMMPVVYIAGADGINTALWNNVVAALGIVGIYLALQQLRIRGWTKLKRRDNILLALALGFGTVQYFMAIRGPVYYISQILTATILSFSIWLTLLNIDPQNNKKSLIHAFFTGLVFSTALLARPNIGFAVFALIAIQYEKLLEANALSLKKMITWLTAFSLPIVVAVLCLAGYNQIRFGSPFDFGYRYMLVVDPVLTNNLNTYGQLHPHYIARNFFDNFLRLPAWDLTCQRLTPVSEGMSIFLVSPIILFLTKAKVRKVWVAGLWLSTGAILLVHLLYFNSGAFQFGYRFSLDFTPLIFLLLATAFKERLTKFALVLLASGLIVNFIGVLWVARVWCVNW